MNDSILIRKYNFHVSLGMLRLERLSLFMLAVFISLTSYNQDNFIIGAFGPVVPNIDSLSGVGEIYHSTQGVPTDLFYMGYGTSQLNVLATDGFTTFTRYVPDNWTSLKTMEGHLTLAKNVGLKMMVNSKDYYRPDSTGMVPHSEIPIKWYDEGAGIAYRKCMVNTGTNIFNSEIPDRANYNKFMNLVYTKPEYEDVIWGHQLVEEAAFQNLRYFTDYGPFGWDSYNVLLAEIPLPYLLDAWEHFDSSLLANDLRHQEIVVMEANHFESLTEFTIHDNQDNVATEPYCGKDVLNGIDYNTTYLEGSYNYIKLTPWWHQKYEDIYETAHTRHYLGTFASIDFAKTKTKVVHDVIGTSVSDAASNADNVFNSGLVDNANWLWFQAYNSIIHGAEGIWFWELGSLWHPDPTHPASRPAGWEDDPNRFARENMPFYYTRVGYLVKELAYLSRMGILSNPELDYDLYTKTEGKDPHCILPPAKDYIPKFGDLPNHIKDSIEWDGLTAPFLRWNNEFYDDPNERYSLRYTIRTNGEDVYMIIANQIPVALDDVELNFSQVSNDVVRNAVGVDILFNNGGSIGDVDYKVDRNMGVDLVAETVDDVQYLAMSPEKTITLGFGPSDVHVLKFKLSTPLPDHDNGWEQVWTNYGSGRIGDWGDLNEEDKFFPGDFNGDGEEELLCIQNYDDPAYRWITLLKYDNVDSWHVLWTNHGEYHPMFPYREYFRVGDFNGDGYDELFGYDPTVNKFATYHFDGSEFILGWTSPPAHPLLDFSEKYEVGDYDGDNKDDLLCFDYMGSGAAAIFEYTGDWTPSWIDMALSPIHPYHWDVRAADFDGNGRDDVLGFDNPPEPALDGDAEVFSFHSGAWHSMWSTDGGTSVGGWTYPIATTDWVVVGNTDYDTKAELLTISTGESASWAASQDLMNNSEDWNWNWSANPLYGVPYIDNWPIADGIGTKTMYFLIKPNALKPSYLMCFRQFGCKSGYKYYISMYKSQTLTNKSPINDDSFGTDKQEIRPLEDLSKYTFNVFPNPNNGQFEVTFGLETGDDVSISLFDVQGKLLYTKNCGALSVGNYRYSIQLDDLESGMYLLTLSGEKGVTTKRIVIE